MAAYARRVLQLGKGAAVWEQQLSDAGRLAASVSAGARTFSAAIPPVMRQLQASKLQPGGPRGLWSWLVCTTRHSTRALSTAAVAPAEQQLAASNWGVRSMRIAASCGLVAALGGLCGGFDAEGAASALACLAAVNACLLAHEAGHMAAARALRIAVSEFSIGIGPRIAWWQGRGALYCLRAFPLLGYVRFATPSELLHRPCLGRALAQAPPLHRAAVLAAGVAANVTLAAALVAAQVAMYGELGVHALPGARVQHARGWMGGAAEGIQSGAGQLRRLQQGDVVLGVGSAQLPAADVGSSNAQAEAHMERVFAAALFGQAHGPARDLTHVQLTVLRPQKQQQQQQSTGAAPAPQQQQQQVSVLEVPALDVLQYEELAVVPHRCVAYRPPSGAAEAWAMTLRELKSWSDLVLGTWSSAIVGWVGGSGSRGSSAGVGLSSSSVASASSTMVGPLGLMASAAAVVREQRAGSSGSGSGSADRDTAAAPHHHASATPHSPSNCNSSAGAGSSVPELREHVRSVCTALAAADVRPPALLDLGIQLNLQLAVLNMIPLPVLDGGQLLLLAAQALRGGRPLPAAIERWGLIASGAFVAVGALALSLRDAVVLMDKAAGQLAERGWGLGGLMPAAAVSWQVSSRSARQGPQQEEEAVGWALAA